MAKKRSVDLNQKRNDMTLALNGPDNVQKDKRYHNQTEETLSALASNWREMNQHREQD